MEETYNWAGNQLYRAAELHYPATVEEVQTLVRSAATVKGLGSRHAFNDIADTHGTLLSLARLARVLTIDHEQHTVTVDGGARYGQICRQLDDAGYGLRNLASLPHISVAGACATATHGSGIHNATLAAAVRAIEFVVADGEVVELSRAQHPDILAGAVVGLGGLGVVTKLTLDVVPRFTMRQDVYEHLPFAQLEAHFDNIMASAYSVSLFTDWRSDRINQVWLKRPVNEGVPFTPAPEWCGATLAPIHRHPIIRLSAEACTPQMGIAGAWYDRLPHFRLDFTPSSGAELQSEYIVPYRNAVRALHAVYALREFITPHLQISEVRAIAADELWMSPCYGQACIAIHFTWHKQWEAVREVLPLIEAALMPLEARPHWGKLFTMPAEVVQSLYPRLSDFRRLLHTYDPNGKFRNPFLYRYLYDTP